MTKKINNIMTTTAQSLNLPTFTPSHSLQSHQYSHLHREGGFRLEQQNIQNKHIFHNYGQGDAELSLSYGSAYIISKIITVRQDATKIKEVAVIGGGINALMTCLELLKRGYKVALYAPSLPIKKEGNTKIVGPQEGLQFWYPGGYDNCDPLKHELIAKLSFQFFKECLYSNRYQSLKQSDCLLTSNRLDTLRQHVTDYLNNTIKPTPIKFSNELLQQYISYKTILIDTRLFIEQIFTELKLRNVAVTEMQFRSIEDVMGLREQCVFNCLGGEVRGVFGDTGVEVMTGCYYSVQGESKAVPETVALWIGSEIQSEEDVVIAVFNNRLQIGGLGSRPANMANSKEADERILTRAYHFIKERTIKPFKL